MSWTDDPFVSNSDDEDFDDPFLESPFSTPATAPESEFPDPLADTLPDTLADTTDRFGELDPFAGESSGSDIVGAPPVWHRLSAHRRLWLAAAVLFLAALGVGLFTASLRDDGIPTLAESTERSVAESDASGADLPQTDDTIPIPSQPNAPPISEPDTSSPDDPPTGEVTLEPLRGCDDQSGLDPHGLISFGPGLDRLSFCGEKTWQVFVCTARDSDSANRVAYIDKVLGKAAAWFKWASGEQYDIDFSAGDDTSVVPGGSAVSEECFESVLQTQWSETRSGAVVLLDEATLDPFQNYVGVGTCGYIDEADSGVFGDSGRMVAIAVHAPGDQAAIAVHELGHAQCWPHSYSGKTGSEYDNPVDVVSSDTWPVGTLAVNRYASGWIHPDQVRVHRTSTANYDLAACCDGGVQMLALLPKNVAGQKTDIKQWWHLEVRDPKDEWERGLTNTEVGTQIGVSVHWIDRNVGFGYDRRQAQVGDQTAFSSLGEVVFGSLKGAGSEFCLHSDLPTSFATCSGGYEWRIEVTSSQTGGLNLTVSTPT